MKVAYYPGCSSAGTGVPFEMSTQYVAKKIGLELATIPDWNCCGASAAHLTNHDMAMALPARNLAKAEKLGLGLDVATPCAACYARLKVAKAYASKSEENRHHLEELMEMPYNAKGEVYSILEVMARPELREDIKKQINKPLQGLKVACYYGCLLARPSGENINDTDDENPMMMDELVELTGAKAVDWAFKTECCGASHQVSLPKTGRVMVDNILHNAQANGAEAIATACPLCMLNLDMREKELNKKNGTNYNMPVYYFTELLAMSMGAGSTEVGVDKHFFPATDLIEKDAMNRTLEVEKPKKKAKTPLEIASEKAEANRKARGVDVVPETCGESEPNPAAKAEAEKPAKAKPAKMSDEEIARRVAELKAKKAAQAKAAEEAEKNPEVKPEEQGGEK